MKGNVTMTGYWPDSPDRNNDFNIIPSNKITMDRVKKPLFGVSDTGDQRIMYPGEEHQFDGNYVLEMPLDNMNNEITDPNVIQQLISNYKQNKMRNGGSLKSYQGDVDPSTVVPMLPVTGVPYAIQTADDPLSWRNIPNVVTSGKPYNAYNVRTNDGFVNGAMQYNPKAGTLGTSFPVSEIAYGLPELGVVGLPNKAGKYAKQFMTENPDPNAWGDSRDPKSPVTEKFLGNLLGVGKTKTNPYTGEDWGFYNRQTNYQNAKDNYIAQNLLMTNPQGDRDRQTWLASFSPEELEIIKNSKKYSGEIAANRWAEGAQGLNNFLGRISDPMNVQGLEGGYEGRPELFKGQLSSEEAQNAGLLSGLGMLAIPAQGIQGWITEGDSRGWAGESPIDYTEGRDAVKDLAGEIALDPLNLLGMGIGKGIAGALPDASQIGKAALYGPRLGTEMSAAGAAETLNKLNQRLARNKGVFAKGPETAARDAFEANPYVTAMDAEAARIGQADYYGTTDADKLRIIANSKLPFDELRNATSRMGLPQHMQNASSREQLIEMAEQGLKKEAVIAKMEPEVKRGLLESLYKMQTGESADDMARLHPYAKNVDEFLAAEGFTDDMLKAQAQPVLRREINQITPDNTYEDRVASSFTSGKAAPEEVIDKSARPTSEDLVPKDFNLKGNRSGSTFTSGRTPARESQFDDLVGPIDPQTGQRSLAGSITGDIRAKAIDAGYGNGPRQTLADYKEMLAKRLETSLYDKGYSKKEISESLAKLNENIDSHYDKWATQHNLMGGYGFGNTPDPGSISYDFGHYLANEFFGDKGAKALSLMTNRSSVKPTTDSILNYAKNAGIQFNTPIDELVLRSQIDDSLSRGGKSQVNVDQIINELANWNPSQTRAYIEQGLSTPQSAMNIKPSEMANRWGNIFKGQLSNKQVTDVNDFYTEAYAFIRRELQSNNPNIGLEDLHQSTLNYLAKDPRELYGLLEGYGRSGRLPFDISEYDDAMKAIEKLEVKPGEASKGLNDFYRQGKAAARSGKFVTDKTANALSSEASKVKQGFVDLTAPKVKNFVPDKGGVFVGPVNTVTPSVFATSYKNSREMALYVRNSFDNGFKNAKVGDVITGALSTSKDSYSLQMDYLMRMHKNNPTSTQPVFLGYKDMNDLSFSDKFNLLSKEEQLNAINVKLNKLQKDTGINFDFDTRFPYVNENGGISIPQWGLQKTQDVPISVSKRKYGGQVGHDKPFIGYLPFTHYQIQ